MESSVKNGTSDGGNVTAGPDPGNPHKGKTGWKRVSNAFFYSLAGLGAAYQHEDAFRQEVLLAPMNVPVVWLLVLMG